MKYIDKIDWSKLDTETIVVTKTDIGPKYNTMYEAHKCNPLTKEIVSLGLFDKVSNELKQDAVFKSKMALAVSNVVEQCLNERRS